MPREILNIKNLYLKYSKGQDDFTLEDISLKLNEGEILGIMGESGSGKSSLALAIMGLLDKKVEIQGEINYRDNNLLKLSKRERKKLMWRKIAIVFQNNLDVLNPLMTVGDQILEVINTHLEVKKDQGKTRVIDLLKAVHLEEKVYTYYPHQLSGGMRQRVLLAMALSCDPDLLIVDEPTTALDAIYKQEIIDLIKDINRKKNISIILISHELQTIKKLSSRINIFYGGSIVESGFTKEVLYNPIHNYTRGLIEASPSLNPYGDLWGIPGEFKLEGQDACKFYSRCNQREEGCKNKRPKLEYVGIERMVACNRGGIVEILDVIGVNKKYSKNNVIACDNCNLKVKSGETISLIGESGSGKTTLGSIIAGVLEKDRGKVKFKGQEVEGNNMTRVEEGIQIVFQDPFTSINENLRVRDVVLEPLKILKKYKTEEGEKKLKNILREVGLPQDGNFLNRRAFTLSGGQRQRLSIARSLIMKPKLLIADEISAMLDNSSQANILRLLKKLQNSHGFSMIYISHDLVIARKISDKIYVMRKGKIIEKGNSVDIIENPINEYTKSLVKAGIEGDL